MGDVNMKNFSIICGIMLTASVSAKEVFKAPDILVDTKLDYDWSGLLITKLRVLMKNYDINDPFKGRFKEPIVVTEGAVRNYLPSHSLPLLTDIGNVIGLNLPNAQTKVVLEGVSYDVKDFKTDLKAMNQDRDGFIMGTDISADEIYLSAEKLSFSLVIPGRDQIQSPILKIDIIKPYIRAKHDRLINFFTQIKIQDQRDKYKFQILGANFDRMANNMIRHPEDIDLNYERIIVPKVSIKIGGKEVNFSPEKIERLLREKHDSIKGIILAQAAVTLKAGTAEAALKITENYALTKEYWIGDDIIKSQMEISKFTSSVARNHVEVQIPGDFCTFASFNKMKQSCLNNKVTKIADSRINSNLHNRSLGTLKHLMESGEANIVASISEDYVNKLLVTTYDAGLWAAALDEAGIELGTNKVIMRLDKRGDSGTLIMDVIYKPSKVERLALGKNIIRFPLVLDVSLRVEKHDGDPVAIVRLNDVDLSDQLLREGKPEHNMISNIHAVPRFKGTIIKTIRNKVASLRGKDIIELRYPEFRNLGLEKVDFLSDGNGRMNAMMNLEDLITAEELN
jgi:hypothetical protein